MQQSVTWRGAFWFYVGLNFLPLLGYYFLWSSVFHDRALTAGFSFEAILTYAVVAMVFSRLTWGSPEYGVMQNIREGTLTKYLVQPVSYFGYYWTSRLSFRFFATVITLPFTALVVFLLRSHLLLPAHAWQWFGVVLALPLAFALNFLFGMALALVTFWMLEARYLLYVKDSLLAFLGGMVIPFAFFPPHVRQLFDFLPFRYLASFPVELYLGRVSGPAAVAGFLSALGWIAALYLLSHQLWRSGLRRYVAVGH